MAFHESRCCCWNTTHCYSCRPGITSSLSQLTWHLLTCLFFPVNLNDRDSAILRMYDCQSNIHCCLPMINLYNNKSNTTVCLYCLAEKKLLGITTWGHDNIYVRCELFPYMTGYAVGFHPGGVSGASVAESIKGCTPRRIPMLLSFQHSGFKHRLW